MRHKTSMDGRGDHSLFIFSHTHGSVAEPAAAINTKSTAATTTTTTTRDRERERDGKRRAMERYVKLIRHKINFKLCA